MSKYINKIKKKLADYSYRKNVFIPAHKKIVSVTFDDVPKSAFENGASVLNKVDKKGTFYIAFSFLAGQEGNHDLYSIHDLKRCVSEGHELGCHTYSHFHFYESNDKDFITSDFEKNQYTLKQSGFDAAFENFSYPFGEQTTLSKKTASQFFTSCRGIDPGINLGKADLNNLKSVKLYEHLNPLERIYDVLTEFDKTGGWLIFYTHDVQHDFSKYGCSQPYLEAVVKRCIDLNFDIKTIRAVIQEFERVKK